VIPGLSETSLTRFQDECEDEGRKRVAVPGPVRSQFDDVGLLPHGRSACNDPDANFQARENAKLSQNRAVFMTVERWKDIQRQQETMRELERAKEELKGLQQEQEKWKEQQMNILREQWREEVNALELNYL
jgi:flagellar motility protein MotE (MotC chaperone)